MNDGILCLPGRARCAGFHTKLPASVRHRGGREPVAASGCLIRQSSNFNPSFTQQQRPDHRPAVNTLPPHHLLHPPSSLLLEKTEAARHENKNTPRETKRQQRQPVPGPYGLCLAYHVGAIWLLWVKHLF